MPRLGKILILLAGLVGLMPAACAQTSFPSPTFNNLTVLGTCTGCGGGGGGGNVFGPGFSAIGHIATWGNTNGTNLLDGGALGTAATANTGNSGANLIFANGNNTLSGNNVLSGTSTISGTINLSALTANTVLCTDGSKNLVSGGCVTPGGNVTGPVSSAVNHVALFNNTTGTLLSDGGSLGTAAGVNTGTSGSTIPLNNTANTFLLKQTYTVAPLLSSILSADCLGTDASGNIQVGVCGGGGGGGNVTGPGTSVVGHIATYGNTSGTSITDGGALGTAATANTGTTGATLGFNNGNKTDSGNNTYSGTNSYGNTVSLTNLTASSVLCTDASKNVVTSGCPGPSGFHTPSISGTAFGTGATLAGTDAHFFTITVGSALVATSSTITFSPAAANAIFCQVDDVTTRSTAVFVSHQLGVGTTTTVNIGNHSNMGTPLPWVAGDKLNVTCEFR